MENNDTSGTAQEEEGLNEEEMNDLIATMEELFNTIDWGKVAEGQYEEDKEDTQQ